MGVWRPQTSEILKLPVRARAAYAVRNAMRSIPLIWRDRTDVENLPKDEHPAVLLDILATCADFASGKVEVLEHGTIGAFIERVRAMDRAKVAANALLSLDGAVERLGKLPAPWRIRRDHPIIARCVVGHITSARLNAAAATLAAFESISSPRLATVAAKCTAQAAYDAEIPLFFLSERELWRESIKSMRRHALGNRDYANSAARSDFRKLLAFVKQSSDHDPGIDTSEKGPLGDLWKDGEPEWALGARIEGKGKWHVPGLSFREERPVTEEYDGVKLEFDIPAGMTDSQAIGWMREVALRLNELYLARGGKGLEIRDVEIFEPQQVGVES